MAGVTINTADGQWISALSINMGTASTVNAVALVASQKVRAYKLLLTAAGAQIVTIQDGSTALTGPIQMSSANPLVLPMDGNPWFTTSAGNALNIAMTSAVNVSGAIWFTQNNQ